MILDQRNTNLLEINPYLTFYYVRLFCHSNHGFLRCLINNIDFIFYRCKIFIIKTVLYLYDFGESLYTHSDLQVDIFYLLRFVTFYLDLFL